MKTAMKAGDSGKLTTLRGLISVLGNKAIEKRAKTGKEEPLSDEEVTSALLTEAKKRKESIEVFKTGGRTDLADNEAKELVVIQEYLPKQMSSDETEKAVLAVLEKSGAKEFGPAMKLVMAELRGKADAALVTEIVKKKLG
jgi:uncharacterized protein YqeY